MAGADIAVTDERIAALVVEYAKLLGRAGTTDTVVIPVVTDGIADEAVLLLGPASQIAITSSHDDSLEAVPLPNASEVAADLGRRINNLSPTSAHTVGAEDPSSDPLSHFDEYGL